MLLAELLESMGHVICASAATEADAIAGAAAFQPDLIIADGNLGEGSGIEAMRVILKEGFVPHIFATGDPYRFATEPGAIIVNKPFTVQTLTRAIERAIEPGDPTLAADQTAQRTSPAD